MEKHISVLLDESIKYLNIRNDLVYVDATLGLGGHSSEILKRLDGGHLYCFDQDMHAIKLADERLSKIGSNYSIIHANFTDLRVKLDELGVSGVDGILFDIGVSSMQFDDAERGFSYNHDARLDMRMNQSQTLDAYEIVNTYDVNTLSKIIRDYSDEKYAHSIAKNIVKAREVKEIATTLELVDIIKNSMPFKELRKKGHPAKKTFQALRIAVNDELKVFEDALEQAIDLLNPQGRLVVITFHSIEDRICKRIFKKYGEVTIPKDVILKDAEMDTKIMIMHRKTIQASEEELANNNRAHSAKMRVCERR